METVKTRLKRLLKEAEDTTSDTPIIFTNYIDGYYYVGNKRMDTEAFNSFIEKHKAINPYASIIIDDIPVTEE